MRLYSGNEGRGKTVTLTDQQIAARAGAGDVAAFVQLVERYRAPLIGYVFGLTGRREEAEELAQDAFCRVWEKLPTLRQRDSLPGWLYRIAHNLAVSAGRRPRLALLGSRSRQSAGETAGADVGSAPGRGRIAGAAAGGGVTAAFFGIVT